MSLPDPRNYAPVNARNPLIRQLMSLMTERAESAIAAKHTELRLQIADLLSSNDHAALNAALNQAPAQDAWRTLWRALRELVEEAPTGSDCHVVLFAVPVVIVAGSSTNATLPEQLKAPEDIVHLLRQHGVLAQDAVVHLSSELASAEAIAAISPCRLFEWKKSLLNEMTVENHRLFTLPSSQLAIKEESAWLRFMIGAVRQPINAPAQIQLGGKVDGWGMAVSQALGEQLKTGNATVLALPRAPQSWLTAQENGRTVLLETRLQLLASSAIRTIRSKGRTPVAVMAAHESGEIRITFSSQEDAERWQGFVWPLSPADSVDYIVDFAQTLFHDCQVQDVRLVDTIQPDTLDGLPFFATAHFSPIAHH